jgi:Cu/Zn superoxide dismutase
MNRLACSLIALYATACGGSPKPPVEETPPVRSVPRETPESEPVETPANKPEPAAKSLAAKAALQPVKGAKQPPGTVTFTQGASGTSVTSDFEGLPRGRYHLVIHEGSECGPNATQAGAAWKGAEAIPLAFTVGGDEAGNLDESGLALALDGVAPIIGQTLVLHDDKKGAPGKALACGTIDAVGGL